MMQDFIVGVIVLVAGCYVVIKFTPHAVRASLAPRLARWARQARLPELFARRLEQKITTAGGCGSCNSCNACATDPVTPPEGSTMRVIPIKPRV
jgi:hypothetical protein